VLDARGTRLGAGDVAWAFGSSDTKALIEEWVAEYLQPDTLLTREELSLCVSLPSTLAVLIFHSNEKHDCLVKETAAAGTLPSDEDIESAISSLKASTTAIEKQCKLLETQKRALREIQTRNASNDNANFANDQRTSKLPREKAQSEFDTAELSESVQAQIERALSRAEDLSTNVQPMAERLLEKDDRLLDGLEKVLPKLAAAAADSSDADEVERLCQALTLLSAQEIHTRIDATYNSALHDHNKQMNGHHRPRPSQSIANQRDSLRAELEELCREIDGLSTMAVENQYRTPISRTLSAVSSDLDADRAMWEAYMSSALHYLTERLEATHDNSHELRGRCSALRSVSAAFRSVQASSVKKQAPQAQTQSPSKLSQKWLKPLRLVQANLSESHDPVAQLLRQLDVRVADLNDSSQLAHSLSTASRDKMEKMLSLASASERAVGDQVSESLTKAEADVGVLLRSCFVHSEYGTTKLSSWDAREGVGRLERKTEELSEQMRELNVDAIGRSVRKKQEAVVS
jgi:hypothetical protein